MLPWNLLEAVDSCSSCQIFPGVLVAKTDMLGQNEESGNIFPG